MNSFAGFFRQVGSTLSSIRVIDIIDILLVGALVYFIISLIRKTKTTKVFQGILIVLITLWISGELKMYTINYILRNLVQIGLLALVVLFQPEIRRFLEKLGTGTSIWNYWGDNHGLMEESVIAQVVMACSDMAETKTDALIIFERDNRLDNQIRTGTIVDGIITAELLKNIFYDKSPLHDGAVIIRDGRLAAAGCMLPLTQNANISRELGMRHRAGIGMSEASDAVVVIVSEETGGISIATEGMLKRHLTKETFEKILRNELIRSGENENSGMIRRIMRRFSEDKNNE